MTGGRFLHRVFMISIENFDHVTKGPFVMTIFEVMLLFGPGALFLFYFRSELYFTLDIFKILLLSVAIALPSILSCILLNFSYAIVKDLNLTNDNSAFNLLLAGLFFSTLGFLSASLLSHWFHWDLSQAIFAAVVMGLAINGLMLMLHNIGTKAN